MLQIRKRAKSGGATDQFSANLMPFAGAEKVIFFREDEKYFRELL